MYQLNIYWIVHNLVQIQLNMNNNVPSHLKSPFTDSKKNRYQYTALPLSLLLVHNLKHY